MTTSKLLENTKFSWGLISFITLSLILGNAWLARNTINSLSATQDSLLNASDVLNNLNRLHVLILAAESGQRGYLLTDDESYLGPYDDALNELSRQIELVDALESELPLQKARINTLLGLTREKINELVKTVGLALGQKERRAIGIVMTGRGRNIYQDIKRTFDEIEDAENEFRVRLFANLNKAEKEARVTFLISAITSSLLLLGMVVLAFINIRIERRHRLSLEEQNELLVNKVNESTKELKVYAEELQRSNRELEDFAFVASHDLQEPLRKIRAFGDRLSTSYVNTLDARGLDYIQRMRNAAERMSDLISDLLDFSRITTRTKDFILVNLDEVLDTVIDDVDLLIAESQATIHREPLPEVVADPNLMYQLLLNLLTNALKFRQSDVTPCVKVCYHQDEAQENGETANNKYHVISVTDNGIGFEQEYADKIFSPFQRLHGKNEYKGTGIGLAVCRRIVERHHGTISASSQLGQGATFTLKLPMENPLIHSHGD
jgi:signal transduction histidine kinase